MLLLPIQLLDMGGGMADAGEEPPPAAAAQSERWLTVAGKLNVRMSSIIMTILIRLLNSLRETS